MMQTLMPEYSAFHLFALGFVRPRETCCSSDRAAPAGGARAKSIYRVSPESRLGKRVFADLSLAHQMSGRISTRNDGSGPRTRNLPLVAAEASDTAPSLCVQVDAGPTGFLRRRVEYRDYTHHGLALGT